MTEITASPTIQDNQASIDQAIFKLEEYTRKNRFCNKAAAIEELLLSPNQESGFNSSNLSGQNLANPQNNMSPEVCLQNPVSISQQQINSNFMNTLSALSQVQQAQQVQQHQVAQQQSSPANASKSSGLMNELLRSLVNNKRKMDFSDSNYNNGPSKMVKREM